jgi:hypothetical protein
LVSSTYALAQEGRPVHVTGLLNDYSPMDPKISGSPYEMHGQWSMDVNAERGTADFSADMTMSDFGTTAGVLDATKGGAGSHTHHIGLTNVKITWNMTGCPTYATSPPKMGFQVERHGQPFDGQWKHRTLRDESAYVHAAGLRHWRRCCQVLAPDCEHYAGVRGACNYTFRVAGHPWRSASNIRQLVPPSLSTSFEASRMKTVGWGSAVLRRVGTVPLGLAALHAVFSGIALTDL